MYSNAELERLYFEYQTEWMPRGMSIQSFCSRNNIPHKVLDGFIRQISRKVVEIQVDGVPSEQEEKDRPGGQRSRRQASPSEARRGGGGIRVRIDFGNGMEVTREGLEYVGLRMFIEKVEVLC